MPDTYYCRVSNFLSDPRDKFIAVAETEDAVLEQIIEYLETPAAKEKYQIEDPRELSNNIRTCIFKRGTKAIHNRPPDAAPVK